MDRQRDNETERQLDRKGEIETDKQIYSRFLRGITAWGYCTVTVTVVPAKAYGL